MLTSFGKNPRFLKTGIIFISVNFILSGFLAKGYAGEGNDKLRPSAAVNIDLLKVAADAPFLRIFPQNVHIGKGSSDVGSGLTVEQLLAFKGLTGTFLGHTAIRAREINEAVINYQVERDAASQRVDEKINKRIIELLKHKEIKEIHLGVGSERKNIAIEAEIADIAKQLEIDLKNITLANLQEVNFNISYEPSIDIKPLKDEELKEMVGQVHQFIYDWFAEKYRDDAISSIWGRTLKVLFRGSVVKDEKKDNASPIMAVMIKNKKNEKIPGAHGVVFATSGKKVEGCLEVAQVVIDAARRDGLQYVLMVNLKSIEDDDKDRTPPEEYVRQIYAELASDRDFIIPEIAAPDVELRKWRDLVIGAEGGAVVVAKGSSLEDMQWEIVKKSALYANKNLALTGIEAHKSILSNGNPTVEANFILKSKGGREITITGAAASGASAGNREALFQFDGAFAKKAGKTPGLLTDAMIKDIYGENVNREEALRRLKVNDGGKGVNIALWIARNVLIPELTKAIQKGAVDPQERYSIDRFMREYEKMHGGNERQKLKLTGANTTAFSTAAAKLGAAFNNMQTWEFLSYRPAPQSLKIDYKSFQVLIPIAVVFEGGEHSAWTSTDFQEYMVEIRGNSFEEIVQKLANITNELEKMMLARGEHIGVGMESAYMPNNVKSNTEPIGMIVKAGKNAGYTPGEDFTVALDCAASEFYREYEGKHYYSYQVEGRSNEKIVLKGGKEIGKFVNIQEEGKDAPTRFLLLTSAEQLEWALDICKNPDNFISSVEDFFDQNDLWGNEMLTKALLDKDFIANLPHEFQRKEGINHVADDFTTSNIEVVKAGIDGGTVAFEGEDGPEELKLVKDSVDAVLLKLNQAGTVMEIMELVEYLRSIGRGIFLSHRGKEPSEEDIRGGVVLASTTYPSQKHNRTDKPTKVKIKYGTARKERAVVYGYLLRAYRKIAKKIEEEKAREVKVVAVTPTVSFDINNIISQALPKFNISQEKLAELTAKAPAYVKSENIAFVATGGEKLREYVSKIREIQEAKPKLKISAQSKIADEITSVEITIELGGIIIKDKSLAGSTMQLGDGSSIVREIENVNNILKENQGLNLREDNAFELVKKIIEKYSGSDVSKIIISRLVELKASRLAIMVDAADFKTPGAISALLEALRLAGHDFKIVIFGQGAANFKVLLGGSDNIMTAESPEELKAKLRESGITNIKLWAPSEAPAISMAATLTVLFPTDEVNKAFEEFYRSMPEAGVITPETYENTKEATLEAIDAGSPSAKIAAIELPETIKLSDTAQTAINAQRQTIADFITVISD